MWKVQGVLLNYSKCICDLNQVDNSHNCHGLKRIAQGRGSNGVEKLQTSPWGCVLQSEPPGLMINDISAVIYGRPYSSAFYGI